MLFKSKTWLTLFKAVAFWNECFQGKGHHWQHDNNLLSIYAKNCSQKRNGKTLTQVVFNGHSKKKKIYNAGILDLIL